MEIETTTAKTKTNGEAPPVLFEAKGITLKHRRLEREIIPLGATRVEVELGEVELDKLQLDPTNPRLAFKIQARDLKNPSQKQLEGLLGEDPDVAALRRSIAATGGLIEAIIVQDDGTVLEGNCRLTCIRRLNEEARGKDSRWTSIRARILPPGVDRRVIDVLLGELHIAGKNEWTPFEQAAHLYGMSQKGYKELDLAGMYRQSKSYINAKIRAYRLMKETFVHLVQDEDHQIKNPDRYWSWFEEFYKVCKPSAPGKPENPARMYDGRELEEKFCDWVANRKIPRAEQTRALARILDNKDAMKIFEKAGLDKAFEFVADKDPTIASKLWKQLQTTTELLVSMPLADLEALRDGDAAKVRIFEDLVKAIDRVKREARK
jgi:hypothetical protein